MNWKSALLLAAMLSASACANKEAKNPSITYDKYSGERMILGRVIDINYELDARPSHSQKSGYFVLLRYSGGGWKHYNRVTTYGGDLPYGRTNADVGHCSSFGCAVRESGVIILTDEQFYKAARDGIEFRVSGRSVSDEVKLPAAAFAEVIALVNGAKPQQ